VLVVSCLMCNMMLMLACLQVLSAYLPTHGTHHARDIQAALHCKRRWNLPAALVAHSYSEAVHLGTAGRP